MTTLNKEIKDRGKIKGAKIKGAFQQRLNETCDEAFNSLKDALTTSPILGYAGYKQLFCCGNRCQSSWSRSCPATGSELKTYSDWFCQPSTTSPGNAVQCHEA